MAQALQDIRNFTVKIEDLETSELAGTGFIVLSDKQTVKIVTAAHVVAAIFGVRHPKEIVGRSVGVYFPQAKELPEPERHKKATIEACLDEYDDDVVLLALEGQDPRPTLFQNQAVIGTAEPSHKNPYISYGFPIGDDYPESTIDGTIVNLLPLGKTGNYQYELVELKGNGKLVKVRKGMSGGAVLDKYRNLVVGIVISFLKIRSSDRAWAADCKVLSFKSFGLNLLHDENPISIPMTPGDAYDRNQYSDIAEPGLELIDAPRSLEKWVGRKDMLKSIDRVWRDPECNLLELVGFGGQGKSSLARKWLDLFMEKDTKSKPQGIFWWDFYHHKDLDDFAEKLLSFLSRSLGVRAKFGSLHTKLEEIKRHLKDNGFLLFLDGFEVMQFQSGDYYGEVKDIDLREFMTYLTSDNHRSFAIVTTRVPLVELVNKIYFKHQDVDAMSVGDGIVLLKKLGVKGNKEELEIVVKKWAGHPLTLTLLGTYISEKYAGDLDQFTDIPSPEIDEPQYDRLRRLLVRYDQFLTMEERRFLQIFCAFHTSVDQIALRAVFRNPHLEPTKLLAILDENVFSQLVNRLERRGFIREADHGLDAGGKNKGLPVSQAYDVHPLIREYFYKSLTSELRYAINTMLRDYVSKLEVPEKPKTIDQMRPAFDEVYYLCQTNLYDEAYLVYQQKVAKVDMLPKDETGWVTTVLSGYQADLELLRQFFPEMDFNNLPTLKNPKDLADILILAGVDLDALGKADEANILYRKCAQIGIENKEWEYATWSYQNQGTSLFLIGRLDEALKMLELALQYARKIDDWIPNSISPLVKMAWNKFLLGEIDSADQFMERAREISGEEPNDKTPIYEHASEGVMYAEILARTGRYDEAMRVSNHNLTFLKKEEWQDDVGCHRVIGTIYEARNNYKKAKTYYDKSVKLIFETGMREETISSLLRRGNLLIELNNLEQANNDLQYALVLAESCKYYLSVLDIRNALVRLAMAKGESHKLRNKLFRDLDVVREKAVEIGYKWAESDSLFLIGRLEDNNGNIAQAIDHYNQALTLQEKLRDPRSELTLKRLKKLEKSIKADR